MTEPAEPAAEDRAEPPRLRCLDQGAAPADLGRDLLRLLALPEAVRQDFWLVLGAYLKPALDDEAQRTIVDFCTRHELTSQQLAPAVKATRFLFQESVRADLSSEDLVADLHALAAADDARELAALLLPWLDDFRPRLRAEISRQTLADHGKLVLGTSWRIEHITRSNRGTGLGLTVSTVTFRYREGDDIKRITLYLLPDQVDALRKAADDMLA